MMSSTFLFCLQIPIFLDVEAGTVLVDVGEVAVADDLGLGVFELQQAEQRPQRVLLCRCPGVGGVSLRVQSALVAYAQRMFVVALGMCSHEVLVACLVQLSVAGDIVVVAGESEAVPMAADELLHSESPVAPRRTAVHDDHVDSSHVFFV